MQVCSHARSVVSGKCSCKAGVAGRCKHATAVCTDVNQQTDEACTGKSQQWGKPSKKPKRDVKKCIADLFPSILFGNAFVWFLFHYGFAHMRRSQN